MTCDVTASHPTPLTKPMVRQVELICASYQRLFGKPLTFPNLGGVKLSEAIFGAPFVVVSHDSQPDPRFNFGNQKALDLWEMSFDEFVGLPSRYSAEAEHRQERQRLLNSVAEKGYFTDYRGVRTSKTGRRFLIERATVFNLVDEGGLACGQAATFEEWTYL